MNDMHQRSQRLQNVLEQAWTRNPFYRERWRQAGWTVAPLPSDLSRLPLTTKDELLAQQALHPPYGELWSVPLDAFTRLHQTSGTRGTPLRWLDTPESWQSLLDCWKQIFAFAGVTRSDRLFFPFSFGPFLGFWTAFEAAQAMGCLVVAGGGMSSTARLRMLLDLNATVLCCTPTYALHLAATAREQGVELAPSAVRTIIVAGEPGGSIPATRARIEAQWGARVVDHSGMTEVGPMAVECLPGPGGLHVLEDDYWIEVLDPHRLEPVAPGEIGELIVTNMHRLGSPVIRYRTGDLVRVDTTACPCGSPYTRLAGGILGRTDDMIPIRGNNFYPSALEGVLRRFEPVVEYRVEVDTKSPLAELRIEMEVAPDAPPTLAQQVAHVIRDELLFRAEVVVVAQGTLPRYEMKAHRVTRK
jgi:phenylacetate-CoA ligase